MIKTKENNILSIMIKVFVVCVGLALTLMFTTGCDKKEKKPANTVSDTSSEEGEGKEESVNLLELSSKDFAVEMGNGTNLGNTMEAYGHKEGIDKETSFYETFWGSPVTTQETFDYFKEAGFNSVRIPVAWTNMIDFENGDYTINEAYLERVKEIIDYAYNDDMFVIINDHWDGGWWGMFGSKDAEKRKAAEELYESMWNQIAEYYKDYDAHLIFEGGNEEIGTRLNDLDEDFNPKGAILSEDECYEKANEINQKFVDIVRATGGNNENRFLLIPGYDTDITRTLDSRWKMPTDSADDKLLLSVHYYTPWSYCGSTGEVTWGTQSDYEEMNTLMENLSAYTEKGYGIIIGECSVGPTEEGKMKPNAILWYTNLYANCDYYGYVPMLWDTNNQMDRETGKWIDDSMDSFFKEHALSKEKKFTPEEVKENAKIVMDNALSEAPETFQEEKKKKTKKGESVAWIMWNSADWAISYSVGDEYNPDQTTEGLKTTDVTIDGEGTYTVALDFTGTANGFSNSTAFSAVGISDGEDNFPGYTMDIKSVKINGEEYTLQGKPYTTSDDQHCTRVNLYNSWVNAIPEDAHTIDGDTKDVSPTILSADNLGEVETIEVTFDYVKP